MSSYFENSGSPTFVAYVCKNRNTSRCVVGLGSARDDWSQLKKQNKKKQLKKYSARALSDAAILKMYCCAPEIDDITLESYCKNYSVSAQEGKE